MYLDSCKNGGIEKEYMDTEHLEEKFPFFLDI